MGLLYVGTAPHIKSKTSVNLINLFWIVALLPTLGWGVYKFGISAVVVILSAVLSAIVFDLIANLIFDKKLYFKDLSSILMGLLIGLSMPPAVPFYYPIIASFVAIVVIKVCSGGTNKNFVSSAAMGIVVVSLIFKETFFNFYKNGINQTDLTTLKLLHENSSEKFNVLDLFLGNAVGAIGEVGIICIIVGGLFLMITKVISPEVPFFYLMSLAFFMLIFKGVDSVLPYIMSGGILFVCMFIATEYSSMPYTKTGKLLYGFGLGLATSLIWVYGNYAMGAYYAVIICGVVVNAIRGYVKPMVVGEKYEKNRL